MFNSLAGAYFVTAAQSLFSNRLLEEVTILAPEIDIELVLATGATELREVFHGADLGAVIEAYMIGITDVFIFSLAGAGLTVFLALLIPLKSLKH